MRNLQNQDVFAFGRIISKANLKEEIKKVTVGNEKDIEAMGFDILFALFTNCSDEVVEKEIYLFLASLFEVEVEEIKKMDPIETFEKLAQVADWEKWKSFFSLGAKLTS